MRRLTVNVIAGSILALVLAGCGESEQAAPPPRDTQAETQDVTSVSDELMNVLSKPQLAGGKLSLSEDAFSLVLASGGTARFDTRIRNEGDMPVTLSSIETAVRAREISFGEDGCRAGTVLQPSEACDLFVVVSDKIGRSIDNEVIVVSDASKSPSIRISVQAEMEKIAAPAQQEPPKAVKKSEIPYEQIAAINDARRMSGWGNAEILPEPEKRVITQESEYPEDMFGGTEATLPVSRKRMITEDQVIKAVLETPFNNIACSRIIAVTDSDTWGYDQGPSEKPLLPAGTRFIGTCNAFTDEKAAIVWTRFITPDGTSARILGAANDAMGRGALPGELDRRWFDKYGIPVIFSSIRSALEYMLMKGEDATSEVTNPETGLTVSSSTPESRAIDRFQGDMTNILGNVMNELRDTQSVLNIPGGTRIDIILGQDVYFKDPYTVVAMGDDEYELPEKDRQQLYRTTPKAVVAGAEGGMIETPEGATKVVIDGKEYWLMPARIVDKDKQDGQSSGGGTGQ